MHFSDKKGRLHNRVTPKYDSSSKALHRDNTIKNESRLPNYLIS